MEPVHAAGGVLWRPGAEGPEVCLIHRPRYDDWSLPKGKRNHGEHPLAAAVREVGEETGERGVPQLRLPTVNYLLPGDVPKRVDFWSMRVAPGGPAEADGEADAIAWLSPAAAAQRASYSEDTRVLRHFTDQPPVTATLLLVRHAHAGRRGAFAGPDAQRPLDEDGVRESQELATLLALCEPRRLVSAAPLRCVQTLQPLAERLGAAIEVDPSFDEPAAPEATPQRAAAAAARVTALAGSGELVVVCSQGKLMPSLLAVLAGQGATGDFRTRKGTGWLLAFAGSTLVGMDPLVPADATASVSPAAVSPAEAATGGRGLIRAQADRHSPARER